MWTSHGIWHRWLAAYARARAVTTAAQVPYAFRHFHKFVCAKFDFRNIIIWIICCSSRFRLSAVCAPLSPPPLVWVCDFSKKYICAVLVCFLSHLLTSSRVSHTLALARACTHSRTHTHIAIREHIRLSDKHSDPLTYVSMVPTYRRQSYSIAHSLLSDTQIFSWMILFIAFSQWIYISRIQLMFWFTFAVYLSLCACTIRWLLHSVVASIQLLDGMWLTRFTHFSIFRKKNFSSKK